MLKNIDTKNADDYNYALIHLKDGDITIKLFPKDAPIAVCNFAQLAKKGFYDKLPFHRVIKGFVAQAGCPDGSGNGGPGYEIKCECKGQKQKHIRGALSMAHRGKDTGGSQFFITFEAQPHLDGLHTVFGGIDTKDIKSLKLLDTIKEGSVIENIEILKEKADS